MNFGLKHGIRIAKYLQGHCKPLEANLSQQLGGMSNREESLPLPQNWIQQLVILWPVFGGSISTDF